MKRRKGFNFRQVASALRPGLLARIDGPKTGIDSQTAENRPPRIAPAASEGIGPTRGTSEDTTRQNGDTAADESGREKQSNDAA